MILFVSVELPAKTQQPSTSRSITATPLRRCGDQSCMTKECNLLIQSKADRAKLLKKFRALKTNKSKIIFIIRATREHKLYDGESNCKFLIWDPQAKVRRAVCSEFFMSRFKISKELLRKALNRKFKKCIFFRDSKAKLRQYFRRAQLYKRS